MIDSAIRQLEAKLDLLTEYFGLEWIICPSNFSSYSESERETHSWGYPYCDEGIATDGYNKITCKNCRGAGVILAKRDANA